MYTVTGADGREYGPVDAVTLQSWVSMGRVKPSTVVTDNQTGQKMAASQITFLEAMFLNPPIYAQPYVATQFRPGVIQVAAGTHSVGTALILALLITGLGQVYNKQAMKGLIILVVSVILAFFTCGLSILLTHPFALIDAILIAQRLNRGEAISDWQCF